MTTSGIFRQARAGVRRAVESVLTASFHGAAHDGDTPKAVAPPHVTVLQVPGGYPTIQEAVDAAGPGDFIHVAAGVYNENVVITTSDLRLYASRGAVIDGAGLLGPGILVAGSSLQPLKGAEVTGFEIRNFEQGVVVEEAVNVRIHRNEVHHNIKVGALTSPRDAAGISLLKVRFSHITANAVHDNGKAGIYVADSPENLIRGNWSNDNGTQNAAEWNGPGIWVTGASDNNIIFENEVRRNSGRGIMISRPGQLPLTGALVAQNQVHENALAGIALMGDLVSGHTVLRNDATGNSTAGLTRAPCYPYDLFDSPPVDNTWERNRGLANH